MIESADGLAVTTISRFELAWLAENHRIVVSMPVRAWLARPADFVRAVPLSRAVAATTAALPRAFPEIRPIYVTAVEHGWQLVTMDQRMHRHPRPRAITGLVVAESPSKPLATETRVAVPPGVRSGAGRAS